MKNQLSRLRTDRNRDRQAGRSFEGTSVRYGRGLEPFAFGDRDGCRQFLVKFGQAPPRARAVVIATLISHINRGKHNRSENDKNYHDDYDERGIRWTLGALTSARTRSPFSRRVPRRRVWSGKRPLGKP